MKKLMAAVGLVLVLAGCNYRDLSLNQSGSDNPAYTQPDLCGSALQHQTLVRLGAGDRRC